MHFKCSLSLVSFKQVIPVENILIVILCINVTRQHSNHLTQLAILVQDHTKKGQHCKTIGRGGLRHLKDTGAMQQHDCRSVMRLPVCVHWVVLQEAYGLFSLPHPFFRQTYTYLYQKTNFSQAVYCETIFVSAVEYNMTLFLG